MMILKGKIQSLENLKIVIARLGTCVVAFVCLTDVLNMFSMNACKVLSVHIFWELQLHCLFDCCLSYCHCSSCGQSKNLKKWLLLNLFDHIIVQEERVSELTKMYQTHLDNQLSCKLQPRQDHQGNVGCLQDRCMLESSNEIHGCMASTLPMAASFQSQLE